MVINPTRGDQAAGYAGNSAVRPQGQKDARRFAKGCDDAKNEVMTAAGEAEWLHRMNTGDNAPEGYFQNSGQTTAAPDSTSGKTVNFLADEGAG